MHPALEGGGPEEATVRPKTTPARSCFAYNPAMGIFKTARTSPKRDTQLKVLMTSAEKAALAAAAAKYDMTTSDLVREAVNDYVERREKRKKK